MVSRDDYRRANARGRALAEAFPRAVAASYDRRRKRVVIEFANRTGFHFAPEDTQGLETVKAKDLARIEVTLAGRGLHFPTLDADLYIPALLEGIFGSKRWTAARLGAIGGKARSAAKAKASRANGRLGGRPRRADSPRA